ncbi:PAS domain-containing sensor histidine kinase [Curvivirga aplysinae]|uniref:PAS domain-containing sensor histidine kinase n=1 Tax=Curvivirga aplysinae TaxID=2529852 RepID=UPI0012BD525E|nr:PAS domain-containing sensor histidine kinase [Curvivirga aplysinae]MTI10241.1 PAS domain-containing sensor histidine kinase [Curvivirga aplysinae]
MPKLDLTINDFSTILDHMDMAMIKLNQDGEILSATSNLAQILSIECETDIPEDIYQLTEILTPSDFVYVKLSLDGALKQKNKFDMAFGLAAEQETQYNLRLVIEPTGKDSFDGYVHRIGHPDAETIAFYNSERRFRNFIENMPNAISYKNVDRKFVTTNKHWNKIFNPKNLPTLGKTVHEFIDTPQADHIYDEEEKIIQTGESIEYEANVRLSDGSIVTTMTQRFPLKDIQGTIVGIGSIHTDMSKHNAVARELNQAKEAAEIANRSKSEFLANMSHELRTPLNAIIGFSEILQNELFGPMGVPSYKEYVDDINDGARHLLEILNDILDMSKVEAGEYHLEEEMFEAHAEVERCLRFIKERAAKNGLNVELAEIDREPILNGDRRVFKQILLNILSNAVKFTESGGTITIRLREDIDGCLEISVADTGIGIAEEDIPIVLQPFGQADTSLTRHVEGTGLGLSLVQRFMNLHQGKLHLESVLSEGTTVYVTFPQERWSWDIEELMSRNKLEAQNI